MSGGVRQIGSAPDDETSALVGLLIASLLALAAAGEAEAACRFSGRGFALLRRSSPRLAQKFNALLHRLAPMTSS
jgi:hypothetical protein